MGGAGVPGVSWAPTHVVTAAGSAWPAPDPAAPPAGAVAPGTEVRVLEFLGAWARAEFSNGWIGWVDARTLAPGTAPRQSAATAPQPARRAAGSGVAAALGSIGAAIAIAGSLLPWWSGGGASVSAWQIPLVSLFTARATAAGVKTGFAFVVLLVVALPLLTKRPLNRWVQLVIGTIPIHTAVLAWRLASHVGAGVGAGIYVSAAGGLIVAYSPLLFRTRRRNA